MSHHCVIGSDQMVVLFKSVTCVISVASYIKVTVLCYSRVCCLAHIEFASDRKPPALLWTRVSQRHLARRHRLLAYDWWRGQLLDSRESACARTVHARHKVRVTARQDSARWPSGTSHSSPRQYTLAIRYESQLARTVHARHQVRVTARHDSTRSPSGANHSSP